MHFGDYLHHNFKNIKLCISYNSVSLCMKSELSIKVTSLLQNFNLYNFLEPWFWKKIIHLLRKCK